MRVLSKLIDKNAKWSQQVSETDPEFFPRLSKQQSPEYLWIGCADSRIPANQIVGLDPGQMFVHRNIANMVVHTDLNCLSVLQYAVEALKVQHIIVCGHYGCGGVQAALDDAKLGLIENWLAHIKDVRNEHWQRLQAITDPADRADRLCELNVIAQVANVCRTTIVRDAWSSGQPLTVHGWVYGLGDGRLRDLNMGVTAADQVDRTYKVTVETSETGGQLPPANHLA